MSEQVITKRCSSCKEIKAISEFHKSKNKKYGVKDTCKICVCLYAKTGRQKEMARLRARKGSRSIKGKAWQKYYRQTEIGQQVRHAGYIKYRNLYPNKRKAHHKVSNLIYRGILSKPCTYICRYCFTKKAEQYHHHLGYAPEHWLDITPTCISCHNAIHLSSSGEEIIQSIP